jgi:renalase
MAARLGLTPMPNPMQPHVAVIGAGIAGLSCATLLQQAGIRVTLFEKSRGAGGRMSTRRLDDWQCDHGAQYFTARDANFQVEVARWQQAGVAGLWEPRLHVMDIDGQGLDSRASVSTVQRFVGTPRMNSPAAFLADGLSLRSASTIDQLQRLPDSNDAGPRWRLRAKEHGWLDDAFDAVLLAVPAPQAAALLPMAPDLANLAQDTVMSGCWTLMLRFATALPLPYDAAFINRGPLRWICRNNSKPGRSGAETWLLHATGIWSEAHIEQDAAVVAPLLLQAFAELGGPAPDAWTAHRWRYAMAELAPQQERLCTWDDGLALGLCGDWLAGGKVEGAWLSGRALAQQTLQTLQRQAPDCGDVI